MQCEFIFLQCEFEENANSDDFVFEYQFRRKKAHIERPLLSHEHSRGGMLDRAARTEG
jgi:hypothetical protein